jgi:hypothetical protein
MSSVPTNRHPKRLKIANPNESPDVHEIKSSLSTPSVDGKSMYIFNKESAQIPT